VCIAICTRNRATLLRRALASVLAQKVLPAEILVIDNAPSDQATQALVRAEFPTVRYALEPVPGLDFARNRALREAAAEVVAFIDDDALAHEDWHEVIKQTFQQGHRVALSIGRIDPLVLETEAQRLFEANGGFSRGAERISLPADSGRLLQGRRVPLIAWAVRIGIGCNMAVRREAALAIGGYDVALDMGAALPGGGDLDMVWRLLQAEHEVVYEPEALVWHEHRSDLDKVYDQIVGHQRAMVTVLTKIVSGAETRQRLSVLAYLCWRLLKPGVRLFQRALGHDPLPTGLLLRMWWQCWLGLGTYPYVRRLAARRSSEAASR
jgi:glycosyltransferase involved in cell wall biosynthesis